MCVHVFVLVGFSPARSQLKHRLGHEHESHNLGVCVSVCHCVCVCACVFSIHPSPRSLQKTKTTAVKGIMPGGNGREKLPITQTQTHTYAPCHDAHPDIPSQLLTPRAQPAQVDILHKHTHIKNIQTVCKNRCSDRSVCFILRQVSVLLSTILTLRLLCFLTSSHPNEKQT